METTFPATPAPVPAKGDFRSTFLSSNGDFLVEETPLYRLSADHAKRVITLKLTDTWRAYAAVPTLETSLRNVAAAMVSSFGLVLDLTALPLDSDGDVESPAIPARGYILDSGLVKVANVIPYNCNEIIHGPHAFSINSVEMRPFTDLFHAEKWLTSEMSS